MFLLKLLFRDEGHLYVNCLFYIPTIYPKCHRFHYFSRGIRMPVPILTGVQNGRISLPKNNLMLKKTFFLRLYFRDEGHFYAKCLFDILTIYPNCHRFHFFSRGIRMYIPITTEVQNGRISCLKDSAFFATKCSFWSFFSMMKVTSTPNACFIFRLFILNAIFFSSLVVAYVCTFLS